MIHRLLKYTIPLSLFLLPACTQDDEPGAESRLMEFSTSISGQPRTRVSETAGGMESTWSDGDRIFVQVTQDGSSSSAYCTLDASGNVTDYSADLYWKNNTASASVLAWYSNITGSNSTVTSTISLADQSNGLAYVLRASASANNGEKISLSFSHQLAKVRVKVTGDGADDVNTVKINNYKTCNITNGYANPGTAGYITAMKNGEYFEANVVPTTNVPDDLISFGDYFTVETSGIYTLKAGMVYTITIDAKGKVEDSEIDIQGHTGVKMRDEDGDTPALWIGDRNIGAESETDAGLYFWWGDVVGHTADEKFVFSNTGYNGTEITTTGKKLQALYEAGIVTSNDEETAILCPQYDAATQKWGSKWRMPTNDDFKYLIENCTWNLKSGSGYEVTAPNGNTIFLPFTGYFFDISLDYAGQKGYFWSSNVEKLYSESKGYVLLTSDNVSQYDRAEYKMTTRPVYNGNCIRPVSNN